ncbi:MAG: Crp/Fnr family transcriptional regulator [Caulobacter sp.]|nr:Crp/Fnr family transcriptional regulator [Caulobacter sp.]
MDTINSLLKSLSSPDLERLAPHLSRVERRSGVVLYEPEDAVDWVYFPESGLVSIISVMLSGEGVESGVIGREGGIGFVEAAGAGLIFSRAVVQIDLVAHRVPAAAYLRAFDASPAMRRAVASHIELTIAECRQTIACIAHHEARQRLAWWILECQDRTGLDRLPLTQEFLSAMLAIQRTTVSAVAASLKSDGLIGYSRGTITVRDRAGLEAAACECYRIGRHMRALIEGAGG